MELQPQKEKCLLPALPEFMGALPTIDKLSLSSIDARLEILVEAAHEKGFSEETISSMLSIRQRLYAERANAWKHFTLYDNQLDLADQVPENAHETVVQYADKAVDSIVDPFLLNSGRSEGGYWGLRMVSNGLPFIDDWLNSNGINTQDSSIRKEIRDSYESWIADKIAVIRQNALNQIRTANQNRSAEGIIADAERAVRLFQEAVFSKFDNAFLGAINSGIQQISNLESVPRAPEQPKQKLLGRIASKLFAEMPTEQYDLVSEQMRTLAGFFSVSRTMTEINQRVQKTSDINEIIQNFKMLVGLDTVESMVSHALSDAINKQTTDAFFAQYEERIDQSFRDRYRSNPYGSYYAKARTRQESTHHAPLKTDEVYRITDNSSMTSVSVTKPDITPSDMDKIINALAEPLSNVYMITGLNSTIVNALLTEAFASDDQDTSKKIMRRVMAKMHTDGKSEDAQSLADAQTVGAIFDMFKVEMIRINKIENNFTITVLK